MLFLLLYRSLLIAISLVAYYMPEISNEVPWYQPSIVAEHAHFSDHEIGLHHLWLSNLTPGPTSILLRRGRGWKKEEGKGREMEGDVKEEVDNLRKTTPVIRWLVTGLQVRIFSEFRMISQIWEATAAKRIKTDPYCQRQNCSPLKILFSDV